MHSVTLLHVCSKRDKKASDKRSMAASTKGKRGSEWEFVASSEDDSSADEGRHPGKRGQGIDSRADGGSGPGSIQPIELKEF